MTESILKTRDFKMDDTNIKKTIPTVMHQIDIS